MAKRTAIIDIGSNSARMIIIERTSRFGFYLLEEVKSRVRIGEGAYENGGNLQDFAIERAINALREFLTIAKFYKCRKILSVATSAVRDAPNKSTFLQKARKELGLHIKVIDGDSEALLGGIAAANLLPIQNAITIDIGGGSTEFALIENKTVIDTISLNLGTVRLKELFFDKELSIKEAIKFIHTELQKLPSHFKSAQVVGIGGTIRALAKAIMAHQEYPLDKLHGFTFKVAKEKKFIQKIIESPITKLKKFSIKKERYDVIKEGALIFLEALKAVEAKEVITSGVGVREGVFLKDLLRNHHYKFPANFEPSVRSLLDRFCIEAKNAKCLYRITKKLYEALYTEFDPKKKYEKELLIAAKLANIGKKIDFYEHHKHSAYIILNDLEYNLTHHQIALIATLVRYHKKRLPSKNHISTLEKLLPPNAPLNWMSFLLALAEGINKDLSCPEFEIEFKKMVLSIKSQSPLYLAKEEIKNIEKPATFAILFETPLKS